MENNAAQPPLCPIPRRKFAAKEEQVGVNITTLYKVQIQN